MFESIDQLPDDIKRDCTPEQQAEYMRVYNVVFEQTQGDAIKATAAAHGAITKMRVVGVKALRAMPNGNLVIGGWMMKFSDATDKDSYDTFFSRASKLMLEYYPSAPLWMEHGMDNDYGVDPVGKRIAAQIYGFGVWGEHEVYADHPRFAETKAGLENGEFSYSSDSIGHYVDKGFNEVNGRLDVWPFAGCSLTRSPAEVSLGPVSVLSLDAKIKAFIAKTTSSELEAQVAQKRNTMPQLAGGAEFRLPVVSSLKGESIMPPEQLAALAEFLGVEANPQAVAAALQQLQAQLQAAPAEGSAGEQEAMMSQLRAALGLDANAKAADISAKFDEIRSILSAPARSKLNIGALKKFVGLANTELDNTPADADLPYYTPDDEDDDEDEAPARRGNHSARSSRYGFSIDKKSRKPGFLDLIGAITQVRGGEVQFEMPSFKSQRTSAGAALRAMNINSGQGGGWMLNREMVDEILQDLYAKLLFDKLGVAVIPMSGIESITMNRLQSGATAYWAGEDQTTADSGETKIQAALTLTLRELVCEYPISNRLLANSSPQLESMIKNDIIRVMTRKKEYSYLYGTGSNPGGSNTGPEPLGLYNTTGITKTAMSNKFPTFDQLIDMEGRIEDTDIEYGPSAAWVSHNKTRRGFKKIKNQNGDPIFMESFAAGGIKDFTLMGYPFYTSTQIPVATSQTDLFLGEWESAIIGQGQDLEMIVDTSVLVRKRQTLIQVVDRSDFGVSYKEGFQILTGVAV